MAIRKSVTALTNTGTNWNVIGEPIQADSFYGYTDGLMSLQIIFQNLVGGVGIQGTLALNPQPEDWFWINLNPSGNNVYPYLTYPRNPLYPTGSNGGDTGTEMFTFVGNFTYIRVILTRDYIQSPQGLGPHVYTPGINPYPWTNWIYGELDKALLCL